jgi:hypothetical protein
MSGIRVIFDDIKEKLLSIKDKYGERVFKTVDLNRGQMMRLKGFENTEEIVMFPAVFFKPEEIKNLPRPNNVNLVEMRIRLYVVTSEIIRNDVLDIFDLPELANQALLDQKWVNTNLVSIKKGFEVMPETFDNTQIYELNYWVKFWDTSAYQYREYVDANDPEINPEAPVQLDVRGIIDDDGDIWDEITQ